MDTSESDNSDCAHASHPTNDLPLLHDRDYDTSNSDNDDNQDNEHPVNKTRKKKQNQSQKSTRDLQGSSRRKDEQGAGGQKVESVVQADLRLQ